MAVVAWLLFLLSCSIAGHATPTSSFSSLAAGWQEERVGEKSSGKAWIYHGCSKTPSLVRSAGIRCNDELDEVLVKRTSSRLPLHRPWLTQRPTAVLQTGPPTHLPLGAPSAPHVFEGPDLSMSTPLHVPPYIPPTKGSSAPHLEPGSLSKRPFDINRRPRGSLKNDSVLKARAARESRARTMQKIKDGVLVNRLKPNGSPYTITTKDELQAYHRAHATKSRNKRTEEAKVKMYQRKAEGRRLANAKREAQREAQREGRIWQGSPVRKRGRPRRNWEQEQMEAEEARQHALADARREEAMQRAVDVPSAPSGTQGEGTSRLRTPETSSSLWPVPPSSLPKAAHYQLAAGRTSPSPDLELSLTAPSSTFAQWRPPRQATPPPARTREEEWLRLTLAPPDQHAPPGEDDRLRLALAPPRYD